MEKPDYRKLISERPLIKMDVDYKLKHGQLFGFKGSTGESDISAAYPCWSHNGTEIQFVLFMREDGRPCIDNCWNYEGSTPIFTNEEPIIVEVELKKAPTTLQSEICNFFTGKKD